MAISYPDQESGSASPRLLHQVFEQVARAHADRIAVEVPPCATDSRRVSVTYAELDALADRIAAALGRFVTGECIVATHLSRRDPSLYAAQLGIMKAGAAYTSLPSATPDEVLRHILQDSQAVAVVTSREFREHALALGVPADS